MPLSLSLYLLPTSLTAALAVALGMRPGLSAILGTVLGGSADALERAERWLRSGERSPSAVD